MATLIGGLAALMLYTAVSASSNVVISSREAMNTYYRGVNLAAEQSDDALGGGQLVVLSQDGSKLNLVAGDIDVTYYAGGQVGSAPVVVYSESEPS